MTGEATEVGSIVGYLILNRNDWTAGVRATERDADKLGRLSPSIRIQTNTGEVLGQLALVQAAERKVGSEAEAASKQVGGRGFGLIGALLSVAPAAVPIGAVAGGALAGLIPTLATVALGVKGVQADMKDGSLTGTRYAADLAEIKSEGQQLQRIAAGGLLTGIDKALATSHGLLPEVNRDFRVMSGQVGEIVGSSGPALLALLHDLDPLFMTFGNLVEDGAQHFEHWATSSDDVQQFVAYVQAELPEVVDFLGQLLTTVGHLAQASEGAGSGLIAAATGISRAINAIPIGVLQVAIPLAVSLKAALLGYRLITPVITGTSTAVTKLGAAIAQSDANSAASAAAMAGVREAAYLRVRAAQAAETATSAAAAAEVAEAQAEKAAAARAWGAAYDETAAQVALAARAEATVAAATAEEVAASAAAAAAATETAATTSSVAWGSMLGPIGAVVIGGGLLATMFLHSGKSAQEAAAQVNTYTDAIKADSGALGENTRQAAINALQKAGALEDARKLGINLELVTDAALGQGDALAQVNAQLLPYSFGVVGATKDTHDQVAAAKGLSAALGDQNGEIHTAVQNYKDQQAAMGSTTSAAQSQKAAIDQLNTSLQSLVQTQLSQAQSENSFRLGLAQLAKQVKNGTTSLNEHTAAGLQNRATLLQLVQSADQAAQGSKNYGAALARNIQELEQTAIAAGLPKKAVRDLIAQMHLTPSYVRTKFDADTRKARADAKAYIAWLESLPTVTIGVNFAANRQSTINSQVPGRASGGGLPEGLAWVGEKGPELAAKHGSRVDIIPHGSAMAFAQTAGLQVPGFASGTNPTFTFAGTKYASQMAADNAASRADKTLAAELPQFTHALMQSTAQLLSAEHTLIKDLQNADATHAQLAAIRADFAEMNDLARQRDKLDARLGTAPTAPTAYDRLASARDAYNQTRSAVSQALLSGFDITSSGTLQPDQFAQARVAARLAAGVTPTANDQRLAAGGTTFGSIMTALQGTIATGRKFDKGIRTLGKEHLSKTLLEHLAEAGPEQAGATVEALLGASKSQIHTLTLQYGQLQKLGATAGKQTADVVNGKQLKAAQELVVELRKERKAIVNAIEKLGRQVVERSGSQAGTLNRLSATATARARGQHH